MHYTEVHVGATAWRVAQLLHDVQFASSAHHLPAASSRCGPRRSVQRASNKAPSWIIYSVECTLLPPSARRLNYLTYCNARIRRTAPPDAPAPSTRTLLGRSRLLSRRSCRPSSRLDCTLWCQLKLASRVKRKKCRRQLLRQGLCARPADYFETRAAFHRGVASGASPVSPVVVGG